MPPRAASMFSSTTVLVASALALASCDTPASPSLPLFGAFFPFWLVCTAFGVLGAVALRMVFIRLGIDEVMPWRLLVYTGLAAILGFTMALLVYGR